MAVAISNSCMVFNLNSELELPVGLDLVLTSGAVETADLPNEQESNDAVGEIYRTRTIQVCPTSTGPDHLFQLCTLIFSVNKQPPTKKNLF